MMDFELWLDESGEFTPEDQAKPNWSPSLVGGILIEKKKIPPANELAQIVSQGAINAKDAHGTEFSDWKKHKIVIPALEAILQKQNYKLFDNVLLQIAIAAFCCVEDGTIFKDLNNRITQHILPNAINDEEKNRLLAYQYFMNLFENYFDKHDATEDQRKQFEIQVETLSNPGFTELLREYLGTSNLSDSDLNFIHMEDYINLAERPQSVLVNSLCLNHYYFAGNRFVSKKGNNEYTPVSQPMPNSVAFDVLLNASLKNGIKL